MFERSKRGEQALLIQPYAVGQNDADVLEEFAELARSAGATVIGSLTARVERPTPSLYIGSGKADEARMMCDALEADLVLVNQTLSPVQERNLERHLERRVVDLRTMAITLILVPLMVFVLLPALQKIFKGWLHG